ncbi:MAG: hypothetical protein WBC74_04275, partial [Candidatus Omnitrophota bacterium]
VIYNFEKRTRAVRAGTGVSRTNLTETPVPPMKYESIPLKRAYVRYAMAAAVIVGSGIWLAYIGKELSEIMGLNQSFVGSLFIGLATTLPEITVSVTALLIGAREIAVANMLGSNLFNMVIIFTNDILYRKAPILEAASPDHAWQAFSVMAMTAAVILAMATKQKKKFLNISWYVPVLFIIFLVGAYFNFMGGGK